MRSTDATQEQSDFTARCEPHRREIQVHCYRMLGSFEDSEDLVQETFLRAWRSRDSFDPDEPGRDNFRAWLYRIATNACLDVLRNRKPRVTPPEIGGPWDPEPDPAPPVELEWLQPYPDELIEATPAPAEEEPGFVVATRETMELAYIAAIQHLPPLQRAALILRDVLGWSARDAASLLDTSVPALNSALQRSRETMRRELGARSEWRRGTVSDAGERELLERYLKAHEESDTDAIVAMLREDARLTMPPHPTWYEGREAIAIAIEKGFSPDFGKLRGVPIALNHQPAVAWYRQAPGEEEFEALAFDVLRIEDGRLAEISSFVDGSLFERFGLSSAL